jgi:hypothetical protein
VGRGRGAWRGYQSLDLTWTVVTGQGFLIGVPDLLFFIFLPVDHSCWVCLFGFGRYRCKMSRDIESTKL